MARAAADPVDGFDDFSARAGRTSLGHASLCAFPAPLSVHLMSRALVLRCRTAQQRVARAGPGAATPHVPCRHARPQKWPLEGAWSVHHPRGVVRRSPSRFWTPLAKGSNFHTEGYPKYQHLDGLKCSRRCYKFKISHLTVTKGCLRHPKCLIFPTTTLFSQKKAPPGLKNGGLRRAPVCTVHGELQPQVQNASAQGDQDIYMDMMVDRPQGSRPSSSGAPEIQREAIRPAEQQTYVEN